MKNGLIKALVILLTLITSCTDNNVEVPLRESPYKESLLSFLESKKHGNTEFKTQQIDELKASLDFRKVSLLGTKQEIFIVELKSLSKLKYDRMKAVFFTHNNELINLKIIAFEPIGDTNLDYESLTRSFIENKTHNYSGKTSVFTVYQDLLFFNEFEHGRLRTNGAIMPATDKNKGGRTNTCYDWYLVTTYYGADGSITSQTRQYVKTICDCEQYTTRISDCGGGDGSSGSPPANPQPGDTFTVNLPNGISRLLQFNCTGDGCFWVTIATTLPAVVVETNRNDYYFLPLNAIANQLVFGPDGLLYSYNANWMQWEGIVSSVTPCKLAKFLKENQAFIDKMKDLQSKTNLNYETGYTIKKNSDGTFTFSPITGNPNEAGIGFNVNSPIDGYIHTHYSGLLSIFSPDDIRAMFTLLNNNLMSDTRLFTTGVVTANGTTYVLQIENKELFEAFAHNFLADDVSFNLFSNLYQGLYQITTTNSIQQNEESFIRMLKITNSGLNLLKGNFGSFNDWNFKEIDNNNNVVETDCD